MIVESAPRCVQCDSEMPNGLIKYPELCVCQHLECPNYGIFQIGRIRMDELDRDFPLDTSTQ